jgi:hypothetical protein
MHSLCTSICINKVDDASIFLETLWAETHAMFHRRLEFMVVFVSLLNLYRDGRRAMA